MHEYSIALALMERINAEASARGAIAVHRVRVRIGGLSGIEPELLRSAFEIVRERTICWTADLEIDEIPAAWACSACSQPIAPGGVLRCPACGEPAHLSAGDEIVLDRLEMEVP
ncbi:MAG: hydrogenase maturation nickel metallochaperone HypA [Acidobacteriota bacterium]